MYAYMAVFTIWEIVVCLLHVVDKFKIYAINDFAGA